MACSFLGVTNDLRELRVQRLALPRGRPRAEDRTEQRVREPEALAVELEHPRLDRVDEAALGSKADGRLHEGDHRIGERGDHTCDFARRSAEPAEAFVNEGLDVGRMLLA